VSTITRKVGPVSLVLYNIEWRVECVHYNSQGGTCVSSSVEYRVESRDCVHFNLQGGTCVSSSVEYRVESRECVHYNSQGGT